MNVRYETFDWQSFEHNYLVAYKTLPVRYGAYTEAGRVKSVTLRNKMKAYVLNLQIDQSSSNNSSVLYTYDLLTTMGTSSGNVTINFPATCEDIITAIKSSVISTVFGSWSVNIASDDVVFDSPGAGLSFGFSNPSRSLNSAFQISSTRNAAVSYSVDIACTATLIGGQTGTVYLEYADDSGFTTNVKEIGRAVNGNSVSLALAVTLNQTNTAPIGGLIPAGKYVRIRTQNNTGTPTFTFRSAQEVLL